MTSSTASLPQVKLRIGSEELSEGSGGFHDHVNPATGKVQARVPLAGKAEMDRAVEAAAAAFETWRWWKPSDRRDALIRLGDLIERNASELVRLQALDVGSATGLGGRLWSQAKDWNNYYAGWADKLDGSVTGLTNRDGELRYSISEPYGVVGVIITWNGPVVGLTMKVSPVLAAGNTVVIKPSEMTAHSSDLYARLAKEAGIPDGVLNMVPGGPEAGEALVAHPKVQKISFTGGPVTARKILASCAAHLKPAVVELGGKSASIVFPDANLDQVAPYSALFGVGLLSGQGCTLPTRLLVHSAIYDETVKRVVKAAEALVQGDPFDPKVVMGPVVNQAAVDRILGMIDRARSSGAGKIATGGKRCGGALADGFFIEPTVIVDVDPKSEIAQTEVFGPVLCVLRFETEDEAIALANDTEYGLAAFLHTASAARIQRMTERLRAGSVLVAGAAALSPGTPFGGLGLSGYGREGGRQGIEEFIRPKTVGIGKFSSGGV